MPNWCEGTLKVRGKKSDIVKWVKENLIAYSLKLSNYEDGTPYYESIPDSKGVIVNYDDPESEEICIEVTKDTHIDGTHRNFVLEGRYWALEVHGIMILVLDFKAAWAIDSQPYVDMSQKYHVDFRLYGFEQGMQFNQEVIVECGQLIADKEITFDDYDWECINPRLGG